MLRISGIKLELNQTEEDLKQKAAEKLGVRVENILTVKLFKKSLDARKNAVLHFLVTVEVTTNLDEDKLIRHVSAKDVAQVEPYQYSLPPHQKGKSRPVIVGAGPAGLFAALILAEAGENPLVLERGYDVDKRAADIADFWKDGTLNTQSNVQFGEGGAGTFSDGKLVTGTKDSRTRKVLEEFVRCGAPEDILYLAKPHIGTDKLRTTIKNLRHHIVLLGGEFRFGTRMERLVVEKGHVVGLELESGFIPAAQVILAIGHSARDTLESLHDTGVPMERKAFSLGVRIEHSQQDINRVQYGAYAGHPALGAADYRLAAHLPNGRGVYTFCMCPGGVVVAAASEENAVVVNGMSEHARDGHNGNSALLVGVDTEDFPGEHILAGMHLQQSLERAAFLLGGGEYRAPVQLLGDFLQDVSSRVLGEIQPSYRPGYSLCNLSEILPEYVTNALRAGVVALNRKLPGFAKPDAVLTGVETRSSSPVRIQRNDKRESPGVAGLYPCGEGAGYAGGIVSAAVDGIRTAEALLTSL